ncbi:unnamed protein product [Soboliphyme baturini]|uniref:DNA-directed RNA polymerase II subunit RPB7 n=1 Tax=Soboliphyme baturini TaxID=241478 RepID=A0A183IA72_9BILA|nr:unnamed protein product [Soboliphyme baturini]
MVMKTDGSPQNKKVFVTEMYFLQTLKSNVLLNSCDFNTSIMESVRTKLSSQFEGASFGALGMVVRLYAIDSIGQPIDKTAGGDGAVFPVEFRVVAFRPVVGERLCAVVEQVNARGIICRIENTLVFICRCSMPYDLMFMHSINPPFYRNPGNTVSIMVGDLLQFEVTVAECLGFDYFVMGTLLGRDLGVVLTLHGLVPYGTF